MKARYRAIHWIIGFVRKSVPCKPFQQQTTCFRIEKAMTNFNTSIHHTVLPGAMAKSDLLVQSNRMKLFTAPAFINSRSKYHPSFPRRRESISR
jgi:hypothetical protein